MKTNYVQLSILVFISLFVLSCSEDAQENIQKQITSLTTTPASSITTTSAVSGGNITEQGESPITARGVVWNTAANPTIDLTTKTTDGAGTGTFSSTLNNLIPNTTYFVRAYATNNQGTVYGSEVTFTTLVGALPEVTTIRAGSITGTNALSGGNIINDGGSPIISRGVVWSTDPNPTVGLATKTAEGSALGSFTSSITDLKEGERYYFRAYATNASGTAYGKELSFYAVSPFAQLDNAIINKMSQYNIPGVSIAIVKNEKLVYLSAYGFADKEANEIATTRDLYRIASVSKPITAIAILKLVQDGRITLQQKVFGPGSILGEDYGAVPVGSKKNEITVKHLLDHTSGWTNQPNDPMFSDVNRTQAQIITDLLANRPLSNEPGNVAYYLNFGYAVLGRVIEKVSGQTYESYIQALTNDMGVTTFEVGGNTLADRVDGEVKYYQNAFSPYAMNVTRMDSHGGLISSSIDLARFITYIDRSNSVGDVIKPELLSTFYFGYSNWYHTGSLPGTSTIMCRLDDTFSFIVLANTRSDVNVNIVNTELYNVMSSNIPARASWPSIDMFK